MEMTVQEIDESVRSIPNVGRCAASTRNPVVLYCPIPEDQVGSHMTLAIGICTPDGILIAADGRVARRELGDLIIDTDSAKKIYTFGGVGIAAAGFKGLTDELLRRMQKEGTLATCEDVHEARTATARFLREYMADFKDSRTERVPSCSFLLAGYDGDSPYLYCMHSGRSFEGSSVAFNAVGEPTARVCADSLALLLFKGGWDHLPTLAEAKLFAATAIRFAARITDGVGFLTQMVLVTSAGCADISDEIENGLDAESRDAVARIRAAFPPPVRL